MPSEEKLLDHLMVVLEEMNPQLHARLSRVKQFGLMTWILGWGVYSNSHSIWKIKQNLKVLQDQNILQGKQIKELAKHLNFTMTQVSRHEEMLYELDSKLLILNQTLQMVMVQLSYVCYETNLVDHMKMRVNQIYTTIYALKEDIDLLYEYMSILGTKQLNPLVMPPDVFCKVLEQVQEGIQSNAWLRLSEDPYENIWAYYSIVKVTLIILEDRLIVIMTIPLIDNSLGMNLYKVHNLSMLHPRLGIQAEYKMEGECLAILVHGMYAILPHATDIKLCKMSQGHLCMLDHALYPIDHIEWCLYALFTNDLDKIKTNCIVKPKPHSTNLAHSLDGYLWAVSSVATEKLQV